MQRQGRRDADGEDSSDGVGISSGMTPGMTPKAPPDKPGIVQKNAAGSKMPGHVLDFSPNSL